MPMVCVCRTRHNVERFKGLEGRFLRTNQALPKRQVFRPAVSLTIDGLSTKTSGGQRFKDRRGFHELNRSSRERGFFFHRSGCIRAPVSVETLIMLAAIHRCAKRSSRRWRSGTISKTTRLV